MGKKELLALMLYKLRLIPVVSRLALNSKELTVLAYHRIYNLSNEDLFPFDPELVSASVNDFEWQMRYIKKCFYPCSFGEVIECLESGRQIPERAVIVTFDDGHEDNYKNAYPVLASLEIPATIFLSTGYIEKEDIFWFDEVAYRIYRAEPGEYSVPVLDMKISLKDIVSRRQATDKILLAMKRVKDRIRREALAQIRVDTNVEILKDDRVMSGNLTWAQVGEMANGGIEFGSHTVSHPILTKVGDDQLKSEMQDSRRTIENHIGKEVQVLAYPVGGTDEFDERVINAAREAGYLMGVSYITGVNKSVEKNLYDIKRLHVERYTCRADFQAMIELPGIFA